MWATCLLFLWTPRRGDIVVCHVTLTCTGFAVCPPWVWCSSRLRRGWARALDNLATYKFQRSTCIVVDGLWTN